MSNTRRNDTAPGTGARPNKLGESERFHRLMERTGDWLVARIRRDGIR